MIHTTAGVAALVVALWIGARHDFLCPDSGNVMEHRPASLTLVVVGGTFLWMGWFGFNAGSAFSAAALASSTAVATQIASVTCATVVSLLDWHHTGSNPSVAEIVNGAIAGLAGVTPAAGYLTPGAACVLGVILGFGSYFSVRLIRFRLRIDDALDVR